MLDPALRPVERGVEGCFGAGLRVVERGFEGLLGVETRFDCRGLDGWPAWAPGERRTVALGPGDRPLSRFRSELLVVELPEPPERFPSCCLRSVTRGFGGVLRGCVVGCERRPESLEGLRVDRGLAIFRYRSRTCWSVPARSVSRGRTRGAEGARFPAPERSSARRTDSGRRRPTSRRVSSLPDARS